MSMETQDPVSQDNGAAETPKPTRLKPGPKPRREKRNYLQEAAVAQSLLAAKQGDVNTALRLLNSIYDPDKAKAGDGLQMVLRAAIVTLEGS